MIVDSSQHVPVRKLEGLCFGKLREKCIELESYTVSCKKKWKSRGVSSHV